MTGAHRAEPVSAQVTRPSGTVVTLQLGQLGREPALTVMGLLGPLVALLFFLAPGLSTGWHVGLAAATYLAAGGVTAAVVRGDRLVPLLLGLAQALGTVALGAASSLPLPVQAVVLGAAALPIAAFTRTQVLAPSAAVTVERPPEPDPPPSPDGPADFDG